MGTGEAAAKLKAVLTQEEQEELKDGGEVSTEDILVAQMAAGADDTGITFVAFTATPKSKTLEIFGTRPDPTRKPAKDNVPRPFHVYSMQQPSNSRPPTIRRSNSQTPRTSTRNWSAQSLRLLMPTPP